MLLVALGAASAVLFSDEHGKANPDGSGKQKEDVALHRFDGIGVLLEDLPKSLNLRMPRDGSDEKQSRQRLLSLSETAKKLLSYLKRTSEHSLGRQSNEENSSANDAPMVVKHVKSYTTNPFTSTRKHVKSSSSIESSASRLSKSQQQRSKNNGSTSKTRSCSKGSKSKGKTGKGSKKGKGGKRGKGGKAGKRAKGAGRSKGCSSKSKRSDSQSSSDFSALDDVMKPNSFPPCKFATEVVGEVILFILTWPLFHAVLLFDLRSNSKKFSDSRAENATDGDFCRRNCLPNRKAYREPT